MNVAELIEALSKYPDNMIVKFDTGFGESEVKTVTNYYDYHLVLTDNTND